MLAKARSAAAEFGESWESIMRVAIRMSNIYASTSYDEDAEIAVIWHDHDIRELEEKVLSRAKAAAELVGAGFDGKQSAIEAGFSEDAADLLANQDFMIRERQARLAPVTGSSEDTEDTEDESVAAGA